MNHHSVQRGIVRMLFDPAFAAAVHEAPASTGLAPETLAALRTIDPRALRADPLRRRRTFGALAGELKASTTLGLAESRSLAALEAGFFGSPEFHASIEERTPMALAFGRFLLALHARGALGPPAVADVIRFELMQARARREARPIEKRPAARVVRLAPGCVFGRFAADVLACVQRAEQYLFELSLLPQMALADDAPRPVLPDRPEDLGTVALIAVPVGAGLTVVTLDDELAAVIEPLAGGRPADRRVLVAEAGAAIGRARAAEIVAELVEDEILEGLA